MVGGELVPLALQTSNNSQVNVTKKRHAVACALAASALPPLVMARGHKINQAPRGHRDLRGAEMQRKESGVKEVVRE